MFIDLNAICKVFPYIIISYNYIYVVNICNQSGNIINTNSLVFIVNKYTKQVKCKQDDDYSL